MYRQELGLDIEKSAMPVVVQVLIQGERSGVVFSQSPNNPAEAIIEAVYGLNQGLVDGTVEPDRWILTGGRYPFLVPESASQLREFEGPEKKGGGGNNPGYGGRGEAMGRDGVEKRIR